MATYTLTVTASEPNPAYSAEAAREAEERSQRGYPTSYHVTPTLERQVVVMALTEAQFNAVRRACLEVAA